MKRNLVLGSLIFLLGLAAAAPPAFGQGVVFQLASLSRPVRGEGLTEAVAPVTLLAETGALTITAGTTINVTYNATITNAPTLSNVLFTGWATAACNTTIGPPPVNPTNQTVAVNGNTLTIAFTGACTTGAALTSEVIIAGVRVDAFDSGPAPSITVTISGNNPTNTQPVTATNNGIAVAIVYFPSTKTTFAPNFGPEGILTCAPPTADDTPATAVFDIDIKEKAPEFFSTLVEETALSTVDTIVTAPAPTAATQLIVTFTGLTPGLTIEYDGDIGPDATLLPGTAGLTLAAGTKIKSTSFAQVETFTFTVFADNPAVIETADLRFSIFSTSGSATGVSIPGASTVTASVSLGPTGSLATPPTATPSLTFAPNTQGSGAVAVITDCITSLLWPFVTNNAGFDSGIAIANTSKDPFVAGGALPLAGPCQIWGWAGTAGTALGSYTTPSIPAGGTWAQVLSAIPVFAGMQGGYLIAICQFQNAHAFAFITNNFGGAAPPDLAQGYLALVIPNPAIVPRSPAGGGPGEALAE